MDQYILGIDAAWTEKEPSGVALLRLSENGFIEIIKAGRSYDEFISTLMQWDYNVPGSLPKLPEIIDSCRRQRRMVSAIALDIPLSPNPITARRTAENLISRAYGKYGAATHSPTITRPGKIASTIFAQLVNAGYDFSFKTLVLNGFIEVYPHAAIIELLSLEKRLQYKVQKRNKYWPDKLPQERLWNIIINLNFLVKELSRFIVNIEEFMPKLNVNIKYSIKFLKGYEDVLDAIICALVGCYYLEGKAIPYGDESGAIWVPKV